MILSSLYSIYIVYIQRLSDVKQRRAWFRLMVDHSIKIFLREIKKESALMSLSTVSLSLSFQFVVHKQRKNSGKYCQKKFYLRHGVCIFTVVT
jgi:hypothetical protein